MNKRLAIAYHASTPPLVGSVTDAPDFSGGLLLSLRKAQKLAIRAAKYRGTRATLGDMLDHLDGEIDELNDALDNREELDAVLDELADVSNCCDVIAFMLVRGAQGRAI